MDFAAERKRLLQQLLQQEIDDSTYERLRARLDEAERASVGDPERTSVGLLAPGFELDGYRLVDTLGGGGMGEVWAARHEQSKRDVALKILPEPFQKLPAELARFRATFHLVDKLHHPHICPLYELKHFAHPRIGWYQTMRLLRGRNLREFIEQTQFPGRRLPLDLVLRILRPVALALDYAHKQEVVHRDIKPENIFLEGSGLDILHVWLIDFGVAAEITATMTNVLPEVETVGSRWYLAPEVWQAKRPKGTTDQYALACVAYELFEGTLPFQSPDQYILRQAVLHDAVEPVNRVPAHVNAALLRALDKIPANRFESCTAFVEALSVTDVPVAAKSATMLPHGTASLEEEIVFAAVPDPEEDATLTPDTGPKVTNFGGDYEPATEIAIQRVRAATEKSGGTWPIPENGKATLRALFDLGAFDLRTAVSHAAIAAQTGREKGNLLRDLTAAGLTLQYRQRGENAYRFHLTEAGRSVAKPPPASASTPLTPSSENNLKQNDFHSKTPPIPTLAPRVNRALHQTAVTAANLDGNSKLPSTRTIVGIICAGVFGLCAGAFGLVVLIDWLPRPPTTAYVPKPIHLHQLALDGETRGEAPSPLRSPFTKTQAEAGQRAWAAYLGRQVYEKNSLEMELALIPPGSFQMGSPMSEKERSNDEGPVSVTLARPFWLGRTEVTRKEWKAVMGTEPWGRQPGDENHPATEVSWENCMEYCRRLTERDGDGWTYRLPTEAEWEWACRGGTLTAYWFGNELNGSQANCDGECPYGTSQKGPYKRGTTPVSSYGANPFGLRDTQGNVWEWCADWYQEKLPGGENPEVTSGGSSRVARGGSWVQHAVSCRSAFRSRDLPGSRSGDIGFRVLAVPSPR